MPLHDLRLVRQRPQPPLLQLHLPIPFPLRLLPRGGRTRTHRVRQSPLVDVAVILVLPLSHVRDETQLSRPLDQFGYLSLILGAQSTLHSIHDLPPGSGVPSQQRQVVLMQESSRNGLGVSSIHLSSGIQIGGEEVREGILSGRALVGECPPVQLGIEVGEVQIGIEELFRVGRPLRPRSYGVVRDEIGIVLLQLGEFFGRDAVFLRGVGFERFVFSRRERFFRAAVRVDFAVGVALFGAVGWIASDGAQCQSLFLDATGYPIVFVV
mmetsp:Transcript_18415/g.40026  ORF Transcript_18415/g.40026 Transcript_18415/m.40026 type:complete len:267 (+) Transcript_18415:405-1205(+)